MRQYSAHEVQKNAIKPNDDTYERIKITKIPKGPAVAGVVIFNKNKSKQRLTKVTIDIIIFNISVIDYTT